MAESTPPFSAQDGEQTPAVDRSHRATGPMTVLVALSAPDWTGRHVLAEVTAESALAAQQWDERNWRRT